MAQVRLNPALEAIQGKAGDMVFKRSPGEEIVARMPGRTGPGPSNEPIAQPDRFRLAVLYGKAVLADPQTRTLYDGAAAWKGFPAFDIALGHIVNAQAVEEVDLSGYSGQSGEIIRVRAREDVELKGVIVILRGLGGDVLEEGAAIWSIATWAWTYMTTTNLAVGQAVSIEVTAIDRPGHKQVRSQKRPQFGSGEVGRRAGAPARSAPDSPEKRHQK